MFASLLAIGLDPQKSTLFLQSQVDFHANLAWYLSASVVTTGHLSRMTQFKSSGSDDLGRFVYPCLMAADILAYDADVVPVGHDQLQHVEFCRNAARSFNASFPGAKLVVPDFTLVSNGARIMSLKDGTAKMSKSKGTENSLVFLDDDDETIAKKIRKAKTDSLGALDPEGDFDELVRNRPELANLVTMYSCATDETPQQARRALAGLGNAELKSRVGDALISQIAPIRRNLLRFESDRGHLDELMKIGAEKARETSESVATRVERALGLAARFRSSRP